MKMSKMEWFFIIDKLQIRPAERFFVGSLSLILMITWLINSLWPASQLFDDVYYTPVIEAFHVQSARNYIEREQVLARYYPGNEDAISKYVVQAIPVNTPERSRGEILKIVNQLKSESIVLVDSLKVTHALGDTLPIVKKSDATVDRININTASMSALMKLPGVGQSIALRILSYREEHGPFKRIEDIMKVRGIGPKTFERFANMLEV
jgi:comEA protein